MAVAALRIVVGNLTERQPKRPRMAFYDSTVRHAEAERETIHELEAAAAVPSLTELCKGVYTGIHTKQARTFNQAMEWVAGEFETYFDEENRNRRRDIWIASLYTPGKDFYKTSHWAEEHPDELQAAAARLRGPTPSARALKEAWGDTAHSKYLKSASTYLKCESVYGPYVTWNFFPQTGGVYALPIVRGVRFLYIYKRL